MKNFVTRSYQVRVQGRGSEWARIWITDDGCISIVSDYGNFGYWFGGPGCEFRKFLTRCGDDYLANKFADGERDLDQEATSKAARKLVLDARRSRGIGRELARREWDYVKQVDWSSEYDYCKWYFEETKLVDCAVSDVLTYIIPNRVTYFLKVLWPLFVEQLKAELAREALHTHHLEFED